MIRRLFIFLTVSLISTQVLCDPEIEYDPPKHMMLGGHTPQSYKCKMDQLIREHGPENIAVVYDLHGVMTDEGTPRSKKVRPRGHMPCLARIYQKMGVTTVYSSAWVDFKRNLFQLKSLNLCPQEELPIRHYVSEVGADELPAKTNKQIKAIETWVSGQVASCRPLIPLPESEPKVTGEEVIRHGDTWWSALKQNPFYRLKCHALDAVIGESGFQPKVVVLVDDTPLNLSLFEKWSAQTKWGARVDKIILLRFSDPTPGKIQESDLLKEMQEEYPMAPTASPPLAAFGVSTEDGCFHSGTTDESQDAWRTSKAEVLATRAVPGDEDDAEESADDEKPSDD